MASFNPIFSPYFLIQIFILFSLFSFSRTASSLFTNELVYSSKSNFSSFTYSPPVTLSFKVASAHLYKILSCFFSTNLMLDSYSFIFSYSSFLTSNELLYVVMRSNSSCCTTDLDVTVDLLLDLRLETWVGWEYFLMECILNRV